MTRMHKIISLFAVLALLSSCVPNRKYLEETEARKSAQSRADSEARSRQEIEEKLKETSAELSKLQKDFALMEKDYKLLKDSYEQQQKLTKEKEEAYDKLLDLIKQLKEEAVGQKKRLDEELSLRTRELNARESELQKEKEAFEKLRRDLEGKDANISDLQKYKKELEAELAGREKRIKDLESAIKERDAQTEALRSRLYDALKGFADAGDLGVEIRNGKVYVSLSQKLLFASGSSRIDKRGLDALKSIAGVLSKSTDLSIVVEGHTDSDGDEKMNWDLSSNRALAVTQELIKNGVEPGNLSAAGRGEHAPKASNKDEKGKAVNRRTEIILEPKLDEIMGILSK
jgi:chemotaxis protein MotB